MMTQTSALRAHDKKLQRALTVIDTSLPGRPLIVQPVEPFKNAVIGITNARRAADKVAFAP